MKNVAILCVLLGSIISIYPQAVHAERSPLGFWTTIDDASGEARSVVEIKQLDEGLSGRIVQLINPGVEDPVCEACKGERHLQKVLGMEILWGLKAEGEQWSGGRILDPNNGKTYSVNLSLSADGSALKVRGYIGFSLLGRTQTWKRGQP